MANPDVLVVGGGIAGLAAALAIARAQPGLKLTLLEQAQAFGEVGAGIQLGPNAMRVLQAWGLDEPLRVSLVFPQALAVRDVATGAQLGRLPLGQRAQDRYGAPYATVHRADLHEVLQMAVESTGRVEVRLGERVSALDLGAEGSPRLTTDGGGGWSPQAVLACDGVWSRLRELVWQDGLATFTGDLAYRGLVPMGELPAPLRQPEVTAWLGPRCHVVHYPVRGGAWMNVVAVVQGPLPADAAQWDHQAHAVDLRRALGETSSALHEVLGRVLQWRLWPLFARPPLQSAAQQARGRLALLGDAAHPMLPYMAQGAAMALEDAWALGRVLAGASGPVNWPDVFARWAGQRWERNAWVQARSHRNGRVFHLDGPLRWARDRVMAALGPGVLDVPRLYSGPPAVA